MAPQARFELATDRLTADSSTTELLRNSLMFDINNVDYMKFHIICQAIQNEKLINHFFPKNTILPLQRPQTYLVVFIFFLR